MLISSLINAESHCASRIYLRKRLLYMFYIYIYKTGKRVTETNARFDPSIWLPVFLSLSRDRPSIRQPCTSRANLREGEEKERRKRYFLAKGEWKEGRKEALSSGDKSFSFESVVVAGLRRVTTIKRIVRAREGKREPVRFLPLGLDPPTRVPSNPHSREVRAARTRHHPVPVQRRVIRFIIER